MGTYGRGFWIMDDLTPLQQMTPAIAASDLHLFAPRDAYRFHLRTTPQVPNRDASAGEGSEYGASLKDYWLSEGMAERERVATLTVRDAAGEVVRTVQGPADGGVNRVYSDLQYEGTDPIEMRATPLYADWVDRDPIGFDGPEAASRCLRRRASTPSRSEVAGQSRTANLEVLKDPNSEGSLADIQAQTEMMIALRRDFNDAASAINQIEWIRRQVYDLQAVLAEQDGSEPALTAAQQLTDKLISVEEVLIRLRSTGTGQDGVRYPGQRWSESSNRHLSDGVASADFESNGSAAGSTRGAPRSPTRRPGRTPYPHRTGCPGLQPAAGRAGSGDWSGCGETVTLRLVS